jgi:D-methionine transport system ATP-binding protein
VSDNIAFPLEVMNYPRHKRKQRVEELLELVGMSDKARAYPAQLSGGQKQRVGIARALAGEPDLLLSDEATSALDPETTHSILELLSQLNRQMGLTILLITHEMSVVRQICDRVAILEHGKIVEQGTVSELAGQPATRLSRALFSHVEDYEPQDGNVLVSIHFAGEAAGEPVFSTLVRQFALDVNILGGSIETFRNQRLGLLQAELQGDSEQIESALRYLAERGLQVEVKR